MGRSRVLYSPGSDEQGPIVAAWLGLLPVAAVVAGAWAIDRYTAGWLGRWREIPAALLACYALFMALILLLLLSTAASVRLTDRLLIVRRPWSRRRWAWTELRDIQIVALAAGTVPLIAVVPEHGPAEALPAPFQTVGMDRFAEQLGLELRLRHPAAVPLDAAEVSAAAQQLRDARLLGDLRRRRRVRWLWIPLFVLALASGVASTGVRIARALAAGRPWESAAEPLLWYGVLMMSMTTVAKPYRQRLPRRWRSVVIGVLGLAWALLLVTALKYG